MLLIHEVFYSFALLTIATSHLVNEATADDEEILAGDNRHYELGEENEISADKSNVVYGARSGFPGDLIVGNRLPNEAVYTRSISITNPSEEVKTGIITFSVPGGEFHYVRAINRDGSFGVMCDEPYTIGGSQTGFKVRSQPNSRVILDVTFAAH